jgi:hypothetical protein
MARVWNTPVFILATVYFVVDGMFSYVTQPIMVWLAKKRLFERVPTLGDFLGALSIARAFCRASHHP